MKIKDIILKEIKPVTKWQILYDPLIVHISSNQIHRNRREWLSKGSGRENGKVFSGYRVLFLPDEENSGDGRW